MGNNNVDPSIDEELPPAVVGIKGSWELSYRESRCSRGVFGRIFATEEMTSPLETSGAPPTEVSRQRTASHLEYADVIAGNFVSAMRMAGARNPVLIAFRNRHLTPHREFREFELVRAPVVCVLKFVYVKCPLFRKARSKLSFDSTGVRLKHNCEPICR